MLLALQQNMLLGSVTLVTVPDVVGETQAQGTIDLEGAGFVVTVTTAYSSSIAEGLIISQNPAGGTDYPEGGSVGIVVSLGESNSGAGASRRRHRYFVHVDGQDFEVRSPEEARQLLQKAVALAERVAEKSVTPKVENSKVVPVTPSVPEIRTNAPIDLEPYQRAIEKAYRNAAAAAELRMLFEMQAQDEEAAIMLLLQ